MLYVCVGSLQQTYEAKRQEFLLELQRREDEMRQMFVQRVKEKEAELKDAEREVKRCRAVVIFGHPQTDDFHVNDHPFM